MDPVEQATDSPPPGASRLASNIASLMTAQVLVRLLSIISFPVLVRAVADDVYGGYLYLAQMASFLAGFAHLSLKMALMQAIQREPETPERPIQVALTVRLLMAALLLGAALVWAHGTLQSRREQWLLLALLSNALLASVGSTFEDALQAREQMRPTALAAVLSGLGASSGILFGALVMHRPLVGAVLGHLVGTTAAVTFMWRAATRLYQRRLVGLRWSTPLLRQMLVLAAGMLCAGQVGALYGRIDLFVVKHFCGLGLALTCYSVAWKAADVAMGAVMVLVAAVVPRLTRWADEDAERLAERTSALIRLGLLVLLPGALAVTGLSHLIVEIFKPQDAPAAAPMGILVWMAPLIWVGAMVHSLYNLRGRPFAVSRFIAVGLVVDGGLCWLWTPRFGLPGAAWGSLLGEVVIIGLSALWLQRDLKLPWGRTLAKPAAMTLAMAATWLALSGLPALVAGAAALAVYALVGWWLQPLSGAEWEQVGAWRRR